MVAALKANLTIADNCNKSSISSGYTVPMVAEQVIKQAALNCAEKYFDDEEKRGLPIRNAMMEESVRAPQARRLEPAPEAHWDPQGTPDHSTRITVPEPGPPLGPAEREPGLT